jgi:hypothetical protein
LRQSRREKRERCDDEFNSEFSVFTSFDWFFFLTCFEEATVLAHKKSEREHRKRAEKRKREFEEEEHKHTPRERNFSTFWSKNASQNYTISLKTSESTSS